MISNRAILPGTANVSGGGLEPQTSIRWTPNYQAMTTSYDMYSKWIIPWTSKQQLQKLRLLFLLDPPPPHLPTPLQHPNRPSLLLTHCHSESLIQLLCCDFACRKWLWLRIHHYNNYNYTISMWLPWKLSQTPKRFTLWHQKDRGLLWLAFNWEDLQCPSLA
jgi:hypothetical protein